MTAPDLPESTIVAGKYTIVALLGVSGPTATYRAVAADGREVALKIFDPAIRRRADIMTAIEQTYAAINALSPEVVAPILDAGYDTNTGAPFSITERIPFPSVAQIITGQRPLAPEELSAVLTLMARALDNAHARRLYHHALKPTNVFLGFAEGQGVRITDFGAGLARVAVPTHEGYVHAAPWLAPEQVQGTAPAGPAADVFATALLSFFALTGRSYWRSCQGVPELATWQHELMSARTPPSVRANELGTSLNPVFDNVLGAALSGDPGQRYRSVGDFARAIELLLSPQRSEASATVAFSPTGSAGSEGDYPPPPPPLAGALAGASPYPAPAAYPGAAAQAHAGGAAPPVATSNYVSTHSEPGRPAEDGRKQTIDLSAARRPMSIKAAPFLVGLVVLIALGGGVIAWVVMGRKPSATEPQPSASSETSAVTGAPTAAPAPPAPVESSAEVAVPTPPSTSAAPPAETAAAAAAEPELTVTCEPDCEEITVDNKPVDASKPIPLTPGKHSVSGSKAGFNTATEVITMVAGRTLEKKLTLTAKPLAPTPGPALGPGPGSGAAKPKCGKFIKTNCIK